VTKTAKVINWLSLLIVLFLNLWVWQNLPDLPNYHIYGLGSKWHVFFTLWIPFAVMILTSAAFMYAPKMITKIMNSEKVNLNSKKAGYIDYSEDILPLNIFWICLMIFLTLSHIFTLKTIFF